MTCCCPAHSDLGPCGACPVHGAMAELPTWALVPLLVLAREAVTQDRQPRERSEQLLRDTLSMLCHFVWHHTARPGDHFWTIPVDEERDFDCILSDAIDELVKLRQRLAAAEAERAAIADAAEMLWTVVANVNGSDWTQQSVEWQAAAARWRDHYFALVSKEPK